MEGDNFNRNMLREAWKLNVKATVFSKEANEPGQEEKPQYIREYIPDNTHNS